MNPTFAVMAQGASAGVRWALWSWAARRDVARPAARTSGQAGARPPAWSRCRDADAHKAARVLRSAAEHALRAVWPRKDGGDERASNHKPIYSTLPRGCSPAAT